MEQEQQWCGVAGLSRVGVGDGGLCCLTQVNMSDSPGFVRVITTTPLPPVSTTTITATASGNIVTCSVCLHILSFFLLSLV